uniref:Uncharacterized protein n=1 Tax=Anopheles farauti TaxID=69004 RepID=A0A182Q602_9DIPT
MKLTIVLLVVVAFLALASGDHGAKSAKHLVDKIVHAPIFGDLLKGIAEHLSDDHQQSTPAASETTAPPPA